MKIGVSTIVEHLRGSLWFIPSLMAVSSATLAFTAIQIDENFAATIESSFLFVFLYSGGAAGARAILSTTAGSMITIAGVSFSIVIVALSLASNQFGPRLLRNFRRDRGNQLVLGTFIATFIYCLLVLGSVRSLEGEEFVPYLATSLGIAMAIFSLVVLIYFIHHVSKSIQADHVVMVVAEEFDSSIERLYPEQLGEPREQEPRWSESRPGWKLRSPRDGYLQAIDPDNLLETAREHDITIDLHVRPGMFLTNSSVAAKVAPESSETDDLRRQIQDCFTIGSVRTIQQDVGFAIDQLVEVAVRSLSPALNDPFTATACLDRLRQGFSKLVVREMPSPVRCSSDGAARLRTPTTDFERLANLAFDPIRHYGSHSPLVLMRMLEVLNALIETMPECERRELLIRHAIATRWVAEQNIEEITKRRQINETFLKLSGGQN